MLTKCSKIALNYFAMHWNTLHYTAEFPTTHCSSDKKAGPYNVAGM